MPSPVTRPLRPAHLVFNPFTQFLKFGAGEMVQWLEALAPLPEIQAQSPASTWGLADTITLMLGDLISHLTSTNMHVMHAYLQAKQSYTYK